MTIPQRFNVTAQDAYNYLASKVFADQQLCMVLKLSGQVNENSCKGDASNFRSGTRVGF